jgi:UDPglucose 6-dehydrogenase
MRRSPAIKIIQKLRRAGAKCFGYDPAASEDEMREYARLFERVSSADDLASGAHALVLVTEWPEFKELDYAALGAKMKKTVIIDSKNHLDPAKLQAAGFAYQGFGRAGKS